MISENDEKNKTLSSSSTASITKPITKPRNGQTKEVSNSEHLSTLKRPYESMPNLTASKTTGGDSAAVQAPTAVPVHQDVSAEPNNGQTKKVPTSGHLSTLKRPYGSMPNLTASKTTGGYSAAVQAPTAVPVHQDVSAEPKNGQTKKVPTNSEHLSTLKRPYGSMPNLTSSKTTGDDTVAVQAPTAVPVQQVSAEPLAEYCPKPIKLADYAGPKMRFYNGLVNAAVMAPSTAVGEVDEIRSPTVTSDSHISAEQKYDRSAESDAKMNRDFVGRPPRRLWRSMPNIALHYTDKVFYDTIDIECITPMQVSRESLKIVIEPAGEITPVKTKRRSLWKRARKFARRVFCCAA